VRALVGQRLAAGALALALALGGCGETKPIPPGPRPTETSTPPPEEVKPRVPPMPLAEACSVTCSRLDPVGPLFELEGPLDEMGSLEASLTFAGGHWYVAWGGSLPPVVRLQRFTADGDVAGDTRVIEGVVTGPLLANGANELALVGNAAPSREPDGTMRSIFWLAPDLSPRSPPQLVRSPRLLRSGADVALDAGGGLVLTDLEDRPAPLIRQVRVAAASPQGLLPAHDARPASTSSSTGLVRLGDARFFLDVTDGALRTTPVFDDGTLGEPRPAFSLPTADNARYVVFGASVAGAWWVAATNVHPKPQKVRLVRIDPATRAPLFAPIELDWPNGHAYSLLDANGTPMLSGSIEPFATNERASFVPVDEAARAACLPLTVSIASLADRLQTVRAVRFEGDAGAAVIDTWGSAPRRAFFTRLRCGR
jgi:hypothetical protein